MRQKIGFRHNIIIGDALYKKIRRAARLEEKRSKEFVSAAEIIRRGAEREADAIIEMESILLGGPAK